MLLALDTSGPFCSAAIANGAEIIIKRSEELGRGHAERLMPLLEEMLKEADLEWSDITRIACTTGPGSFTGLRVGLATARGLALALQCPCVGVTVFEAFAFGQNLPLTIVMDAKREQVWMQSFSDGGEAEDAPKAVSVSDALAQIPSSVKTLIGSGASLIETMDKQYNVLNEGSSPPIEGVVGFAMMGEPTNEKLKPLYLRAPDAKPQKPAALNS